jgi:hypothetical protein
MVRTRWKQNPAFRPRLSDLIDRAPPAVGEAGTEALRQNGIEAETLIRGAAPEDQGNLKESIGWTFGDPPPGSLGVVAARREAALAGIPPHLRISIFAGGIIAPHAHLVHFGTAQRFTDDGKSTGAAPAQPFFFPIIRALRRRMRNRIRRLTRQALKRALQ